MDLLRPSEGRLGGIPKEDQTLFGDVGDSDKVPLFSVSGVEGLLYAFHEVRPALDREFLGEVAPAALFSHLLVHLFLWALY